MTAQIGFAYDRDRVTTVVRGVTLSRNGQTARAIGSLLHHAHMQLPRHELRSPGCGRTFEFVTQTHSGRPAALSPRRAARRLLVAIGAPLLFLFGGAGTWNWPAAWIYMLLLISGMLAAIVVFAKFQPGLAEERVKHARDGTPGDRAILLIIGVLGPASVQLVCGLDRRFGWSAPVPALAQVVAALAFAGGAGVTAWAMAVNAFFSAVVRIQTDRGHTVVESGPYQYVRHPGYAAMLAATIAGPILLGTLWGLVPAIIVIAALLARTAIEDRVLRAQLPGYADYARRVRYRLLPGCW